MRDVFDPNDELLKRLLRFDLETCAFKLGSAQEPTLMSDADAVSLLNLAERYSRDVSDESRLKCLMICGLMWEHRRAEWRALPGFVMNLMSRIGLDPALPMVDAQYSPSEGRLAPVGDHHIEASIAARSLLHEVSLGEGKKLVLSEFQHRVWHAIDHHARIGISAPTSAGKSHVLAYKVVELLRAGPAEVVFVVPTLSLIQQVTRDIRRAAKKSNVALSVKQTVPDEPPKDARVVYVLTQERAQSALQNTEALQRVLLLVVDEIQNIERVADLDDDRSRTLLDVIQEFEADREPQRIIISGPRVGNIADLSRKLLGASAVSITADLPPVVNITYSFGRKRRRTVLSQHTPLAGIELSTDFGPSSQHPAAAFGRKRYTEAVNEAIAKTAQSMLGDGGVLVFSPTSDQSTRTAEHLAQRLELEEKESLSSLSRYAATTVHPRYALSETAAKGVGYHHGKVPPHIRNAVEIAFGKRMLDVLVCTTTLMQGVNLPTKTIIALSPRLYTGGRMSKRAELTTYEFGNLRGRAGRLLKDFVGRSIALDRSSFDEHGVEFSYPDKALKSGLGDRFRQGKQEVIDALSAGSAPSSASGVSDIVVYIRQAVLKYGNQAKARLRRVGITDIGDEQLEDARASLSTLTIPRDLCIASRYWDPLELEKIYQAHLAGRLGPLPNTPFSPQFVNRMVSITSAMQTISPYYFERFLGRGGATYLQSLMISAQSWCAERELHEIINWGVGSDLGTEQIDDRIERILRDVAINLPKLLRPIANIQAASEGDTGLLGLMELGASKPLTRSLMELGLPRDVAIRLGKKIAARYSDGMDELGLRRIALEASAGLVYWDKVQVEDILDPS